MTRIIRNFLRWGLLGAGVYGLICTGNALFSSTPEPTPPSIPIGLGMVFALYVLFIVWLTSSDLWERAKHLLSVITR